MTNLAFLRLDAATATATDADAAATAGGGGLGMCFYCYHHWQKLLHFYTTIGVNVYSMLSVHF